MKVAIAVMYGYFHCQDDTTESYSFLSDKNTEPVVSCLLLTKTLPQYGIEAECAVWNDPKVNWASYDLVISMGVHDYISRAEEFISWLDRLVAEGIRVCNPVDVVKWNMDKHYLLDLAYRGVNIPDTHIVRKENLESLSIKDVMQTNQWDKCVVKPCISMGGSDVYLLQTTNDVTGMQHKLISLFEGRDIMLQEFLPGIKHGEYSCFFFDGEYSYSVIKIPKENDIRASFVYGATTSRLEPPADILATAKHVLQSVGEEMLFARVDIIRHENGDPVLMELEVIEPALYLSFAPECVDELCKVVSAWFEKCVQSHY